MKCSLHNTHEIAALPMGIVAVVGTAMAILLGFRTSSAYNRCWEARMLFKIGCVTPASCDEGGRFDEAAASVANVVIDNRATNI